MKRETSQLNWNHNHFLSSLDKSNFEFVKDIFSTKNIGNIFNKCYSNPDIELLTSKSHSDSPDHNRYPPFADTTNFFYLFLAWLETKSFEEGFWKECHISPRIENSNNRYPFVIHMHFEFYNGTVNFTKDVTLITLIRELQSYHRKSINVSFFGTNASTGLLFGYFLLTVFQTENAELPETTTLLPIMATCMPLYFSISGENLAKKSTSFILITYNYWCPRYLTISASEQENQQLKSQLADLEQRLSALEAGR